MLHLNYLNIEIEKSLAMEGSYSLLLVFISYLIAIVAGYCAFNIINIIRLNTHNPAYLKLLGGVTLGLGIWSMHFIGMLAFSLPIPIYYNVGITALSTLPAMLTCIFVVHFLSQSNLSNKIVFNTSAIMTTGISAMHLVGMAAMSVQADIVHDPILLILAVTVSLTLSTLTVLVKDNRIATLKISKRLQTIFCAILFGFTTANMHYLAMAAVYFLPNNSISPSGMANELLTYSVVATSVILMIVFTLAVYLQDKLSALADLASEQNERIIETIDNMQDSFVLTDERGLVLLFNKNFATRFIQLDPFFKGSIENINDLYSKLSDVYFLFSKENQQHIFAKISQPPIHNDSYKIETSDQKYWLLRRHRTESNNIIQTWTDITEQTHQEQELVSAKNQAYGTLARLENTQTELLEAKKMASLGRLISGVAHELNTPIGTGITALSKIKEIVEDAQIALSSGTMKKSTLDKSFNSIIELEDCTMNNLKRAANLIQKFKFISVEEETDQIKSFNLDLSLQTLLPFWKQYIPNKNILIEFDIAKKITLYSYESVIKQILTNFINNSIEHAFNDNQTGLIRISAHPNNNRVELVYQDNGCGINESVINNIFEPFVTTKRNKGGIGLGLHISYNLVYQKLKGTIKLENKTNTADNQGTMFIIDIPLELQAS